MLFHVYGSLCSLGGPPTIFLRILVSSNTFRWVAKFFRRRVLLSFLIKNQGDQSNTSHNYRTVLCFTPLWICLLNSVSEICQASWSTALAWQPLLNMNRQRWRTERMAVHSQMRRRGKARSFLPQKEMSRRQSVDGQSSQLHPLASTSTSGARMGRLPSSRFVTHLSEPFFRVFSGQHTI